MKRTLYATLVGMALLSSGCSKCYECNKSTSSSSSTVGVCFDNFNDARHFKKDMENKGYSCHHVPEK